MMKRFFFPLMLICSLVLAAQGSTITHVVQKGETLYSIAKLYNTTVEAILKLNNLSDPSKITVGLVLKIPATPVATSSYTVKKGDTLFSIARTFSISVDSLKALNKLTSDAIKVGQVLTVPGKADGATQTQQPTQTTQQTQPVTPKAPANPQVTKPVSSNVNTGWPCDGRVSYLQGNLQGILITVGPKATVRTVRAGVVVSHGPFRGFGTMIFVRASDGLIYVYGGIARSRVKVGDTLEFGAILGETPSDDSNDVFFFVFSGNKALDPAKVPRG